MTAETELELRERVAELEMTNATLRGDVFRLQQELDSLRCENKDLREMHGVMAFEPSRFPAAWGGA